MIKSVLEHIGGIGLYGVISVCLFFAFFTGMLIWAARLKKPYLKTMSRLPLEDSAPDRSAPTSNPQSDHDHE